MSVKIVACTPLPARWLVGSAVVVNSLLFTGCVRSYDARRLEIRPPAAAEMQVPAPMWAHLADGGIVVFQGGGAVGPREIAGPGVRYDFTRHDSVVIERIALDSVIGIEAFTERVSVPASVGASTAVVLSVAAMAGAIYLFISLAEFVRCGPFRCPDVKVRQPMVPVRGRVQPASRR